MSLLARAEHVSRDAYAERTRAGTVGANAHSMVHAEIPTGSTGPCVLCGEHAELFRATADRVNVCCAECRCFAVSDAARELLATHKVNVAALEKVQAAVAEEYDSGGMLLLSARMIRDYFAMP